MITYWPSPAKLNLFLYITGQLDNGYHTIQTIFQFLDYGDSIKIKLRQDNKLNLITPIANISYKDNMIIRAAYLLMKEAIKVQRLPLNNGADFYIYKRIPIGGGLGGGSSNAATVLVALNHLWRCGFTENELATIGIKLGADVPVFIYGRAVFAEGIGEIFSAVQPQEKWYLVVNPGVNVSTSIIFKDPELQRNTPKCSIKTLLIRQPRNICEVIARRHFPEIDIALSYLSRYASFRLTGTGACIFAEFNTKFSAYQVLKLIPKQLESFVARGLNISPIKQSLIKYQS